MNQAVFHMESLIPYSQNGSCHPGGDLFFFGGRVRDPKNGGNSFRPLFSASFLF